jgi:hypothetical protein
MHLILIDVIYVISRPCAEGPGEMREIVGKRDERVEIHSIRIHHAIQETDRRDWNKILKEQSL